MYVGEVGKLYDLFYSACIKHKSLPFWDGVGTGIEFILAVVVIDKKVNIYSVYFTSSLRVNVASLFKVSPSVELLNSNDYSNFLVFSVVSNQAIY